VSIDPTGGLTPEQRETDVTKHDPADEVLISDGLGHKFVSIPGMDNFFTYQLEYKRVSYWQFAIVNCVWCVGANDGLGHRFVSIPDMDYFSTYQLE
jgi:hypothetical protein